MVFLGALLRFGANDAPVQMIFTAAGVIGALLSISWYVVIRSYRQLNTGKFKALHELEQKLGYPFFEREWELLAQGGDWRRYWRLSTVEVTLPIIFFVLIRRPDGGFVPPVG